ncbi:hypothetical protein Tco_0413824 [Tanacetum coccineum]
MSKEVGTPRYLSLVVPLKKVGDEAIHKELGDRIERVATTAFSLEAEHDSGSGPRFQDTILGDVDAQTRSNLVLPIQVNAAEESSIRSDIHLEDAGGTDYLPTATIFKELAIMGYEKPSQKLTFYKAFFSPQWKFLIHTITQCLSAKSTAWNEFSNSGIPTDSNQTPITTQPSSSRSQKKQSRRKQRKDTAVTQEETQKDDSVPTPSNDPPLSGEDRLKRLRKVDMSRRVESSEDKDSLGDHEDASKQGRSIKDIDKDADVSLVDDTQGRSDNEEMLEINDLHGDEILLLLFESTAHYAQSTARCESTAVMFEGTASFIREGKIIMARIWRFIEEVIMKKIEYCLFDVVVEFHREMITSQLQGKLRLYDEVRARTLFVLSSSNRGRLLGIIDLMRQKNKRMKQEGLNRQIGKLQDVT